MSKSYKAEGEGYAQCPFYLRDRPREIHCESFVPGSETLLRFETVEARREFMTEHCYQLPRQTHCDYCRMLLQRYG